MSHVKLDLLKKGEAFNADAYNRSLDTWVETNQGKVSRENIRDQGLDLCNFQDDCLRRENIYGFERLTRTTPLLVGNGFEKPLGSFNYNFAEFDYILRVSAGFLFKMALTSAETDKKRVFKIYLTYNDSLYGNTNIMYFSSLRNVGLLGRMSFKEACRENYTITTYLNAHTFAGQNKIVGGTMNFNIRVELISSDYSVANGDKQTEKVELQFCNASITEYRR